MIRVVVDTNVVVSGALVDGGLPASILDLAANRKIRMIVSSDILAEYAEVLRRPRFKLSPAYVSQVLTVIRLGILTLTGITAFWIDRFEVTNREFKKFVDQGGYRNPEFWKQPFRKGNQVLSWENALREFVDATGPPGPGDVGRRDLS